MYFAKHTDSLRYFVKYRWYLRALNTKKAEKQKITADINAGLISRDMLDSGWQRDLTAEIKDLKRRISRIEFTVESMPETADLLPCKLFLRLHFLLGLTLTETAQRLNISMSTLRRIVDRAAKYFDEFPPEKI